MTTQPRRKLTAIDDPLLADAGRSLQPEAPAEKRTAALYVELPVEQWDELARAAFELRTHKRRIVAALIARHVDASTDAGRDQIRELLDAHRDLCG
jgi:hypothetical protein